MGCGSRFRLVPPNDGAGEREMYYGYFTRNYETWTHRGWGRIESESERGGLGRLLRLREMLLSGLGTGEGDWRVW